MKSFQIKFRYSEKAKKVIKISLFVLTLLSTFKKMVGIVFKFFGLLKIAEL